MGDLWLFWVILGDLEELRTSSGLSQDYNWIFKFNSKSSALIALALLSFKECVEVCELTIIIVLFIIISGYLETIGFIWIFAKNYKSDYKVSENNSKFYGQNSYHILIKPGPQETSVCLLAFTFYRQYDQYTLSQ